MASLLQLTRHDSSSEPQDPSMAMNITATTSTTTAVPEPTNLNNQDIADLWQQADRSDAIERQNLADPVTSRASSEVFLGMVSQNIVFDV